MVWGELEHERSLPPRLALSAPLFSQNCRIYFGDTMFRTVAFVQRWVVVCEFFSIAFWQQFVTTVIGVGLAIPIGLWLERMIEQRRDDSERQQLAIVLKTAIQYNLSVLEAFMSHSDWYRHVPYKSMDISVLEATTLRRFELFSGRKVLPIIENARLCSLRMDNTLSSLRTSFDVGLGQMAPYGGGDIPSAANKVMDAVKEQYAEFQLVLSAAITELEAIQE
jgi:hypothetical protein